MKRTGKLILSFAILACLWACCGNTLELATDRAESLINAWNRERLHGYAYEAEYAESQGVYLVKMTMEPPASRDDGTALRAPKVIAASIAALRLELEDCFQGLEDVDILFAVYDETGTLLYMSLNNAGQTDALQN